MEQKRICLCWQTSQFNTLSHTHIHMPTIMKCVVLCVCIYADNTNVCVPPLPWGRGPSNTDVVLINWAQRREVGLETTWQFPSAYPPSSLPPPKLLPQPPPPPPPLSSSDLDHVCQQVGCWAECLPHGVDILPASSSPGALHCRHSLWQCLPWLWAECWKRCESDRLCGCACRYKHTHAHTPPYRERTALLLPTERSLEREKEAER